VRFDVPQPASVAIRRLKLARGNLHRTPDAGGTLVLETPPLPAAPLQPAFTSVNSAPDLVSPLPPPPSVPRVVAETPPQTQPSPPCSQMRIQCIPSAQLRGTGPTPPPCSALFSPSSPPLPIKGRGRLRRPAPSSSQLESPLDSFECRPNCELQRRGQSPVIVSSSSAHSSSMWDDECGVCGKSDGQLLCCEGGGCSAVFHKACIGWV
jgi:hypothetical protein